MRLKGAAPGISIPNSSPQMPSPAAEGGLLRVREKKEIKLSALEKHRGNITPMQVYKMTCMGSAYRNFRS